MIGGHIPENRDAAEEYLKDATENYRRDKDSSEHHKSEAARAEQAGDLESAAHHRSEEERLAGRAGEWFDFKRTLERYLDK